MRPAGTLLVFLTIALLLASCNDDPSPLLERTPTDWYVGPTQPSLAVVEYGDHECPADHEWWHRQVFTAVKQEAREGVYPHSGFQVLVADELDGLQRTHARERAHCTSR